MGFFLVTLRCIDFNSQNSRIRFHVCDFSQRLKPKHLKIANIYYTGLSPMLKSLDVSHSNSVFYSDLESSVYFCVNVHEIRPHNLV